MIHNFEALLVYMLYPLKKVFIQSLKNNAQLLSTGVKKLFDFPQHDFLHRVVIIDILKHCPTHWYIIFFLLNVPIHLTLHIGCS